ncbi:Uncharacterised protein [Halioglobus japonicus]|nr:Uncharacterised protein [Halioglobus japonicus]
MKIALKTLLPTLALLAFLLPLGGCSCGFDCNNDNDDDNNPALLTLGFSDSLPEDLKQVVIEVDSITFSRSGVEDVVIDTFTIPALDLENADTFQVDLLQYRGVSQLLVIQDLELLTGSYSKVSIAIITGDVNKSYVQEDDDSLKPIQVTSGIIGLPGIALSSGEQPYTVEFGLAQALRYQSSSDTYLLTTNGVRIENNLTAARLSGSVDSTLFDTVSPCSEKVDPEKGNRVYLYKGLNLLPENLSDVFTSQSSTTPPDNAIAPFAVASMAEDSLTGNWNYSFGFIPADSYTVAFSCDTAADAAVEYNGLVIPLPIDQQYEVTLTEGASSTCNLAEDASC